MDAFYLANNLVTLTRDAIRHKQCGDAMDYAINGIYLAGVARGHGAPAEKTERIVERLQRAVRVCGRK